MPRFKPEVNDILGPGVHATKIHDSVDYTNPDGSWESTSITFATATASIKMRVNQKTAWKFRRLAEAIGPQAVDVYETTDSAGFSKFDPSNFLGRSVTVEVEEYEWEGKRGVRVKETRKTENITEEEWAAPKDSKTAASDDIPF